MRQRHSKLAVALLVGGALALAGCGASSSPAKLGDSLKAPAVRNQESAGAGTIQVSSPRAAPSTGTSGAQAPVLTPLIVRSGSITLQVGNRAVNSVFNKVSVLAISLAGFVQSSAKGDRSVEPVDYQPSAHDSAASLVVRVPTDQFASLTRRVSLLGRVESEKLTGTDVTGQSIDLHARITNLDSEESALRSLMARSGSIPNILRVQNELFSVEGQIETLSAEASSLLNRVTYATLSVAIQPKPAVVRARPTRRDALSRALDLAGHNALAALRGVALAIGWSFPIWLLALVLGGLWWLRRRTMRRRHAAPLPSAS